MRKKGTRGRKALTREIPFSPLSPFPSYNNLPCMSQKAMVK